MAAFMRVRAVFFCESLEVTQHGGRGETAEGAAAVAERWTERKPSAITLTQLLCLSHTRVRTHTPTQVELHFAGKTRTVHRAMKGH